MYGLPLPFDASPAGFKHSAVLHHHLLCEAKLAPSGLARPTRQARAGRPAVWPRAAAATRSGTCPPAGKARMIGPERPSQVM